jgi:hypothetical protein
MLLFVEDTQAVLNDQEVKEALMVPVGAMTKASSLLLFYTGNYSEQ